ncbi:hypothetical protein K435DRAFT_896817, partial [Dendrothele bispora CBS 962.96]
MGLFLMGMLGHPGVSSPISSTSSELVQVPPAQEVTNQMQGLVVGQTGDAQTSVVPANDTDASTQYQASGEASDQGLEVHSAESIPIIKTDYSYFKLTGAILEKSVFVLKDFSGLIPVPGLEPAVNAVCACIKHFHKISNNKEKLEKLTEELAFKSKALEKHCKQGASSEMEEQLKILTEKLDLLSNQVNKKLQNKSQMEKFHRVVQPDDISKEIDEYFEAVNNAFDNCK